MSKRKSKTHLSWRSEEAALCEQKHPKPKLTSKASEVDCINCRIRARQLLRTTHVSELVRKGGKSMGKEYAALMKLISRR